MTPFDRNAPAATWLPVAVCVLVTSRFFLPAESAAQGDTLWIVLLWLLCAGAWLFDAYRNAQPRNRPDGLTAAIALLVCGHLVSALRVLLTEGDRRAALNMLWEWVGIAVAAWLIRAVLRTREGREQLLSMILISGVVLAGLGVWQHFIWYPRISAQFTELAELQSESPTVTPSENPAATTSRLRRMEALRRDLGWIPPAEGGSAQMFRDRVQASTEPIGRFALANTFAGLLLVSLFLGLGVLLQEIRRSATVVRCGGIVAGLLIIGYCLWLTKSRTAWAGVIGAAAAANLFSRRINVGRGWGRWGVVAGAVVLIGMPVIAALSGGLDREVLSEAPKSLLYRVEYWRATGRLIGDHWLLGVGPGNYRQHYLQYKLPGSSEEILDPHNLFLDVWANGGLLALTGLIAVLGVAAKNAGTVFVETPSAEDGRRSGTVRQAFRLGFLGTAALAVAAASELLGGTAVGGQWAALLAGWWAAAAALSAGGMSVTGGKVLMAALVGLVVHLTGAGGIAMPAILQVLLILLIAVSELPADADIATQSEGPEPANPFGRSTVRAALSGTLALVVSCALTATLPVTKSRAGLNIGRSLWLADGQPFAAERAFQQAAKDDPLSPDPWQELAGIRFARWSQTLDDDDFKQAIVAQHEAIARDPLNAGLWRSLGRFWMTRFERQTDAEAAREAESAFSEAVRRYPHLAAAQADLAMAAQHSGNTARAQEAARAALRLDELNRRRGHADKYLTELELTKLQSLVQDSGNPAPH